MKQDPVFEGGNTLNPNPSLRRPPTAKKPNPSTQVQPEKLGLQGRNKGLRKLIQSWYAG